MGLFGVKRIECPKDRWTVLISNFAAGMPASWNITFTSKDGGKQCKWSLCREAIIMDLSSRGCKR
jgi:hypothetical protein